ncbi:DUF4260 family protein [Paracoccus saliphilus]|uniref:DUF4260 family protein n=1 Tax=Paracoccus saliphilus TaxID=405559 RepID=A0AA45W638_9RHOB|nr:DUF4260 family protein [Paracoccus saliphilus]WCR01620.1 DUF4260 family protein [Paracoccus saliphilus]SIS98662.1 protein of unknown function [Paracoccus saliphilus]
MTPIQWQRVEGGLVFAAALPLAGVMQPGWPLWLWPLALLAPDLSMLGYLAGPRIGAAIYNAFHLYAGGLLLALLGLLTGQPPLIAAGAIWLAHAGIDRALGYGLKSATGFRDTHLGRIGGAFR